MRKVPEGLLRVQTRANIDRYYLTTRDLMGKVKMHQMAARGDHIGGGTLFAVSGLSV